MRPLSVVLGTKPDLVKMAPVLGELDRSGVPYTYIHTSQHRGSAEAVGDVFGLRQPDVWLSHKPGGVPNIRRMAGWMGGVLARGLRMGREIWPEPGGSVIVHGDTETTLVGALLGRRFKQQVVHVEAGLRSLSLREPFPEELNRIVADRLSDVLFVPDSLSGAYVRRDGRRVIMTNGNTVFDALRFGLRRTQADTRRFGEHGTYSVVSIHRKETLYSRARLSFIVDTTIAAGRRGRTVFIMHEPTVVALKRTGLLSRLESARRVELHEPVSAYDEFVHALRGAKFCITDGGGLQEETWWLNVPCLILRRRTERLFGLGETAFLSGFHRSGVEEFLAGFQRFRRRGPVPDSSPSYEIASHLGDMCVSQAA